MKKILIFVNIFLLLNINNVNSEIFIKAKVNNQIITNVDVKNERNYLLALNPNLRNLPDDNVNRYAIDSLINEKVKKIEIEKYFEILENDNIISKIISDLYLEIGLSSLDEFVKHLNEYSINLLLVKKKISIEVAWNDYIVNKFNNSILIDENKIREKIKNLSKRNSEENILLSEIIFTISGKENYENKLREIEKSIISIGFEETAKIYSVSESKKNGGKIGWVYKSQLSKNIFNQIDKLSIGEITVPIPTPGGFILLKVNDKKNEILKINENEQFKKAVNFEKNRQLTKYSTLHYKRIFNKAVINEF